LATIPHIRHFPSQTFGLRPALLKNVISKSRYLFLDKNVVYFDATSLSSISKKKNPLSATSATCWQARELHYFAKLHRASALPSVRSKGKWSGQVQVCGGLSQ